MIDLNVSVSISPDGQRVLTCLRAKPPYLGLMNFVGGKVQMGESPDEAALQAMAIWDTFCSSQSGARPAFRPERGKETPCCTK